MKYYIIMTLSATVLVKYLFLMDTHFCYSFLLDFHIIQTEFADLQIRQ